MAWIESHQSLATHRKTKRLARNLRMNRPKVIGHLHLIWWWCLDNAPDGNLANIDHADIAEAAMWEKDPEILFSALVDAEFIDADTYCLHDWYDYAGKLVTNRQLTLEQKRAGGLSRMRQLDSDQRSTLAKLGAKTRWNGHTPTPKMPAKMPAHLADDASYRTQPYPTVPNHKEEEEEMKVLVKAFENMGGTIATTTDRENIIDFRRHYTSAKILDAFKKCSMQGKRTLAYAAAILENRGTGGYHGTYQRNTKTNNRELPTKYETLEEFNAREDRERGAAVRD